MHFFSNIIYITSIIFANLSVRVEQSENPESRNTMEGIYEKVTTRHPRHKHGCTCIVCIQKPSGSKHSTTCTCNVCLAVKHSTPPPPVMQTYPENQVASSVQNPTQWLYAHISNSNNKDPNREKTSSSSFKSQNIDLNIQPEREEEPFPVSDSMGIMRLVQESTQRYMKLQKLSINGITDGNHKNHDL